MMTDIMSDTVISEVKSYECFSVFKSEDALASQVLKPGVFSDFTLEEMERFEAAMTAWPSKFDPRYGASIATGAIPEYMMDASKREK